MYEVYILRMVSQVWKQRRQNQIMSKDVKNNCGIVDDVDKIA